MGIDIAVRKIFEAFALKMVIDSYYRHVFIPTQGDGSTVMIILFIMPTAHELIEMMLNMKILVRHVDYYVLL